MPFGLPILAGAVVLGLIWRAKHKSDVVGAGPPGTIVNINPLMGERSASVALGQTVRINLPTSDYILETLVGPQGEAVDPASSPLQAVPSRGVGGFTFTAATQGTAKLTFSKSTTLQMHEGRVSPDINVTINVGPQATASGTAATGQWRNYRRPYREFWRTRWTDPMWRWREEQWRTRSVWDPAWGQRPPPPETVAPPLPTTIAPPHEAQTGQHRLYGYGRGFGQRAPYHVWGYRGWWGNRLADPIWRERESKWRLYRMWDPTWGAQPPIPEQTVTVAIPTPVPVPVPTAPAPAPAPGPSAPADPSAPSDPGY